ncbi:MAG: threonine/serine exporter family protein [Muribaculaceae bacterium]|nr:threonine/serine exporter family protein [Muribaculaceae bacterium]
MTETLINECDIKKCTIPASEMCAFLAKYSSALFTSASTCIRLEKNISRIAEAYGMTVEVTILPRHIHLTVRDCDYHDVVTAITSIGEGPISFELNTMLSKLSWQIADGKIGFEEASEVLERLINAPYNNLFNLPFIVSCANAAFCRLFDGDLMAMAIVFVATFAGYALKIVLSNKGVDYRLTVIACAFLSTVLAAGDSLFGLSATPNVTIGTSVLYLVPGIPFINSFSDMLDRHYICAFGRLMNAIVLTFCLSIGLGLGMLLMGVKMF